MCSAMLLNCTKNQSVKAKWLFDLSYIVLTTINMLINQSQSEPIGLYLFTNCIQSAQPQSALYEQIHLPSDEANEAVTML